MQSLLSMVWAFIPHYVGVLVGFLLALLIIPRILRQKRSPGSTLAWLLFVLFLPYLGAFFYLVLGGRKMKRLASIKTHLRFDASPGHVCGRDAHPLERMLSDYNLPAARSGNRIRFLSTGVDRYQTLIQQIDSARRQIHILMYVLEPDEIGQAVMEHLTRCAQRGIEVRVLLDKLGSLSATRLFLAPLLKAGGQLAFFLPQWYRSNLRNHRKMIIIDQEVVLSGGANIGNEYLSPNPKRKTWEDMSYLLQGPAVRAFAEVFRTDWEFASNNPLPLPKIRLKKTSKKLTDPIKGRVYVIPSGPDVAGDPLYDCLMTAIFSAQQRLWLVTPYFVPDEALLQALRLAAKRCVDVRVLLPAKSNHRLADMARLPYLRELQAAGVKVLFYLPGMMHAKVLLQDTDWALVGTANFDMRSLFLNYEIALCFFDRPRAQELQAWFLRLAKQTKSLPLRQNYFNELGEGLVRLISPLL